MLTKSACALVAVLCAAVPAQAILGTTYPCGPVGPWTMCGQTITAPGGLIMVGGLFGGTTRILAWHPSFAQCHDPAIGPRVAILTGSFLPPVVIPLPFPFENNVSGIVPLWSVIASPINASTWAVDFPAPAALSGFTLRYQYWLTWGDPGLGFQIVGSDCLEVGF